MALYKFSFRAKDEKSVARAQAYDLDASYKDLANVLHAIKGKTVPVAKKLLEDCIAMKKPIRYVKFNKGLGHRSELGGKKGRFPKKEAKIALVLLKSAESNANFKGLDMDTLVVRQGASYKQNTMKRYRQHFGSSITLGYGKQALWASYETCRAELVLSTGSEKDLRKMIRDQKKKAEGKGKAQAKDGNAKKAEAKPQEKKPEAAKPSEKAPEHKIEGGNQKAEGSKPAEKHEHANDHTHGHNHEGHAHQ